MSGLPASLGGAHDLSPPRATKGWVVISRHGHAFPSMFAATRRMACAQAVQEFWPEKYPTWRALKAGVGLRVIKASIVPTGAPAL